MLHRLGLAVLLMTMVGAMTLSSYAQGDDEPIFEEVTTATTVSSSVNLRSDPSTANPPNRTLSLGESVTVLEEITDGQSVNNNALWYRVQLTDGTEGYIWSGAVSNPEVERHCIRFAEMDSSEVWQLSRGTTTLLAFHQEDNRLTAAGSAGSNGLLWRTLVKPSELQSQLVLTDSLQILPITDEYSCSIVGTIVVQGPFQYYAVREAPQAADIRFVVGTYVSDISRADLAIVDAMNEAFQANHVPAINQLSSQAPLTTLLPERTEALVIDDVTYARTPYDMSDNPRYRLESGVWVDQHPGRDTYETMLPGSSPRALYEAYPGVIKGWNQNYLAYERNDGLFFYPGLGTEQIDGSYNLSDLRDGWTVAGRRLEMPTFRPGEDGIAFEMLVAEHNQDFSRIGFDNRIYESRGAIRAVGSPFVERFDITRGRTIYVVLLSEDITSQREFGRRIGVDSFNTFFQSGATLFPDANAIIIRLSLNTDSSRTYTHNQMDLYYGIWLTLNELSTGREANPSNVPTPEDYSASFYGVMESLDITDSSDYFELMQLESK